MPRTTSHRRVVLWWWLVGGVALAGCGRLADDRSFHDAERANTIQAYESYVAEHPEGRHKREAQQRIGDLAWAAVQSAESPDVLMDFAKRYPDHPRARQAQQRAGDLAWSKAKAARTEQAYAEFIKAHPAHAKSEEARAEWGAIAWQRTCRSNTRQAYEEFASGFSQHPRAQEAKRRAKAPERRDYAGSWSRFVDAALPSGISRSGVQGILVVHLLSAVTDAGPLPAKPEGVLLDWRVGQQGGGPEPWYAEAVDGYLAYVYCVSTEDASKRGRRLKPMDSPASGARRIIEYSDHGGTISAIVHESWAAPPNSHLGMAAVYVRRGSGGRWRYTNFLGDTLAMTIGMGGVEMDFYPRLFRAQEMPPQLLGRLVSRSLQTGGEN